MSEIEPRSLGEALPLEMTRVRDRLIPMYLSVGPAGLFAVTMMRAALDRAQMAMIEGDTVAMIRVYQELKEFKE